jgi:glycosyltransferase involved in cell wall biosynthesis
MSEAPDGISVVVPVLDDREGMKELLKALAAQSRLPDECILVDGGSTDGTLELLRSWRAPFPLQVIRRPGRNIAAARNAGVNAAAYEWIASTDAGCRPVRGWLAAIDAARGTSDFVAGVVEIEPKAPLERVLALTHYPSAAELDHPSLWIRISHRLFGRGYVQDRGGGGYMAFSRAAWRAVGGFPEDVYAGEDRAFTSAVVHAGLRATRSADAAVKWHPPATWAGNANMFYRYSRGDIRSPGRGRHAIRLAAWLLAPRCIADGWRARLLMVAAGMAYIALPLHRARDAGLPARDWWRIPVAVALKDLAQLAGAARGLIDAARDAPQPPPARR